MAYKIKEEVEVPDYKGLKNPGAILEALCTEGAFDDLVDDEK